MTKCCCSCTGLRFFVFAIAAISSVLLPVTAKAGSILVPGVSIDFSGGTGGTFNYTLGLGSVAKVRNAPVTKVVGRPSFKAFPVTSGVLNFTTGPCLLSCGIGTHGSSVPQFAPGGSFSISGGIPAMSIANGTSLIHGSFVDFTDPTGKMHPAVGMNLNPHSMSGVTAYIQASSIDTTLLTFYNIDPAFQGGQGELSQLFLKLKFMTPTWNGEIQSSDLLIVPALPNLPEPPSLLLFGTGLLFLAYLVRRNLPAQN